MSIDNKAIAAKVEELVAPVLGNLGYTLIEREFVQDSGAWVLRLYIDREGGVTIDDCARASHAVEDLIAVEEVVPVRYRLEVSTPGIARPLRARADFEKYLGAKARIRTTHPIDGRGNFKGVLEGLEGDAVSMMIDNVRYLVPLDAIDRARLEPEDIWPKAKQTKQAN